MEVIDVFLEHLEKGEQKDKDLFFDSDFARDFICSYNSEYMA